MRVEEARALITSTVLEAIELSKEKGFIASGKTYYSDKALRECANFSEDAILVFGAIKLGIADMDEDDFCTYALCVETKVGMVNDEELEKEIGEFKENVNNLISEISSAPSPADKIREINLRQEEEAEKSMQEFDLEMRKMKLKLYSALAVIGVIVAAIIIGGFLL